MRTAALLGLAVALAGPAPALAQAPAPSPRAMQLATSPKRTPRPPLDPATRQRRQARGILAGGIILTTLCGVGFGLFTYAVVDAGERLRGQAGARTLSAGGALLACTVASISGIGIGAHRLRAASRRVAWTGGLGLRF